MTDISRRALFGKLNPLAYKAVEGATVFCKLRGNPKVELQHWLWQLLNTQDSDLHRIVRHYGLDAAQLSRDMTAALDRLPGGAQAVTDLSIFVENSVERGWVYATLLLGEMQVRSGHVLLGLLKTEGLKPALLAVSRQFDRIPADDLAGRFHEIVKDSPEASLRASDGTVAGVVGDEGAAPGEASGALPPAALGRQEALRRYAVDLTEKARKGELDPVAGRDEEIRQIVDILMRRRQNNPILTGEAGVGKTAVVEGFAARLAQGDVPPQLRDVSLMSLDIGLMQAGASMKGEFEQRLRSVIDEVQASPKPIILFIDEAHTLIGAGGAAGTGDAANLLKPALARGKLRTIAATTWAEYKKHIEKDPALTRRFQVVQVGEPGEDQALLMLRGVAGVLEKHHRVALLDEAIAAAVKLSHRYIPARQLPDKAVSLLDTACARVAVSQHATPAELEDTLHRLDALRVERDIIAREAAIGVESAQRQARVEAAIARDEQRAQSLTERFEREKALVERMLPLRQRLRGETAEEAAPHPPAEAGADGAGLEPAAEASAEPHAEAPAAVPAEPPADTPPGSPAAADTTDTAKATATPGLSEAERSAALAELQALQAELSALQGEAPLILPTVDQQAVAAVVQDWTGIPVGRMVRNEIESVLHLADTLEQRIIGQRHALDMIARRVQTSRARLDNPNRPIGVFMLAGSSGVGKTETALALAEAMYGGEQNVITINMSEFQEAHTVSTLKGAPPGYVGYGEGGVLTEAVRRRPYSIVLLDEVEKAHPDVHEIFFQVFDKGWMEDGEGRYIDFKNTIIILTTNVGTDLILGLCKDPELLPEPEAVGRALREPLLKVFPPALLGRLVTIPYYPLSDEVLAGIVRLQLRRIQKRVQDNHGVPLEVDDAVVAHIISRCTESDSGGRAIDAILTNTVLPRISVEFLQRLSTGQPLQRVTLSAAHGDFAYTFA
jgi:type VI secretion system protein VasG